MFKICRICQTNIRPRSQIGDTQSEVVIMDLRKQSSTVSDCYRRTA